MSGLRPSTGDELLKLGSKLDSIDKWEHEMLGSALEDIRHSIAIVTMKLVREKITTESGIKECIKSSASLKRLLDSLQELNSAQAKPAMIAILAKQLRRFYVPVS